MKIAFNNYHDCTVKIEVESQLQVSQGREDSHQPWTNSGLGWTLIGTWPHGDHSDCSDCSDGIVARRDETIDLALRAVTHSSGA